MFQVPPLYLIFCSNEDYEEISKHREEALRREALAEEALRSGTLFGNDNTTGRVGPAYQPQVHLKPMCQADSGRAASSQLCRCCKASARASAWALASCCCARQACSLHTICQSTYPGNL